jgi:hypothetical protein
LDIFVINLSVLKPSHLRLPIPWPHPSCEIILPQHRSAIPLLESARIRWIGGIRVPLPPVRPHLFTVEPLP